jgi:hypothetical protein
MGVRKLFPWGGQNFPGGQKHTICLKNAQKLKNILYSFKKVEKHTILAGQKGGRPLLPSPADDHGPIRTYVKMSLVTIVEFFNASPCVKKVVKVNIF